MDSLELGRSQRSLRRFTCLCQIPGMRLKSPARAFAPTQSKWQWSRSFGLNWDGMGWVFMVVRIRLDFCAVRLGFLLDFLAAPSIHSVRFIYYALGFYFILVSFFCGCDCDCGCGSLFIQTNLICARLGCAPAGKILAGCCVILAFHALGACCSHAFCCRPPTRFHCSPLTSVQSQFQKRNPEPHAKSC